MQTTACGIVDFAYRALAPSLSKRIAVGPWRLRDQRAAAAVCLSVLSLLSQHCLNVGGDLQPFGVSEIQYLLILCYS